MKRIVIVLGVAVFAGFTVPPPARAYNPETTHAALTEEIVRFYNTLHPSVRVSDEEKEWMIEGSIAEDTTPRWINHFYDPIRRTGWTGMNMGVIPAALARFLARVGLSSQVPRSAIEWAHDGAAQDAYRSFGGVHTWEAGLASYAKGDRKEAYATLGHILHLLEDLSVPDHTRDDTHAHELEAATGDPGSPHESYAIRWTRQTIPELALAPSLAREGARPSAEGSLDDYLRATAAYTNEHFFSADTIGDPRYAAPRIVREDESFAYGLDERGAEFPLASVELVKDGSGRAVKAYRLVDRAEYDAMFEAQFVRAARQTVLNGAGVVARFFEGARGAGGAVAAPPAAHTSFPLVSIAGFVSNARTAAADALASIRAAASRLLASAHDSIQVMFEPVGAGDIVSGASSSAIRVSTATKKTSTKKTAAKQTAQTPASTRTAAPRPLTLAPKPERAPVTSPSAPARTTAAPTPVHTAAAPASSGGVTAVPAPAAPVSETAPTTPIASSGTPRMVIAEVQAEGPDDAGDEFIRLHNAGSGAADLTGWSLQYVSGGSASLTQLKKKNFPDGAAIAAGGYYLIARGVSSAGDDGYRGGETPDLTERSISLSGASTGGTIFVVTNTDLIEGPEDLDIADRVGYGAVQEGLAEGNAPAPLPKHGARIERKALRADGACAAPEEIGESAGNGCDTNNNMNDFLLRAGPGDAASGSDAPADADGSASGTAPSAESDAGVPLALSAALVSSSMSITLSWSGASGTRVSLYDLDAPAGAAPMFETETETQYSVPIDEVAREYRFSASAAPADPSASATGTPTAAAQASLTVPSFVRGIRFSRDGSADSSAYFADVSFDAAPFIPPRWSGFAGGPLWQGVVFYFNRAPSRENFVLTTSGGFAPQHPDGVAATFIFTFKPEFHSDIGGGLKQSNTLVSASAGHFIVRLALPNGAVLSGTDYLTAAYYDFSRVGGGTEDLSLVAIDGTRYFFAE